MSSESSTFKHLIDPSWREQLSNDISAPYFANLEQFVNQARKEHVGEIFPFADKVFSWSKLCTFDKVKVVIIGQDPYPGKKNGVPLANGLAFSVSRETGKIPLSLGNIFKVPPITVSPTFMQYRSFTRLFSVFPPPPKF